MEHATTIDLTGRTVLVTGAARRIGAAIARTLHGAGMNTVLHYRSSQEAAQQLVRELNTARAGSAVLAQADLLTTARLPALIDAATAAWGRLDALVNNASAFYPTPFGEITEAQWDELMGSNLKAPLFLAQYAAPALAAQRGCIVNIADIHAERPLRRYPLYSVAKAGLVMLTKALARELGPAVRVNAVAPGAILWPEHGVNERLEQEIIARTALKRRGEPRDVARAVLFLIREAGYTTGQVIAVDGGRSLYG